MSATPCVVRIVLSPGHRRYLGEMARDAGVPADEMASDMMATLIDDVRKSEGLDTLPRAKPQPLGAVEANGVRVDLDVNTVSFRGKSVEVSCRAAHIAAVLIPAMPDIMGSADLARQAWPDIERRESAGARLSTLKEGFTEQMASIGLDYVHQMRTGYALRVRAE